MFQSTPANFTAGDALGDLRRRGPERVSIHARQFHSGRPPPSSATGAPSTGRRLRGWPRAGGRVSIHARQFHSGRRRLMPRRARREFQSTPANFTAGDPPGSRRARAARPCFNPRPPISQRATRRSAAAGSRASSFNPRPPISQRATCPSPSSNHHDPVSIHARQFHSGRQQIDIKRRRLDQVSIHARQFHSGRL